MNYTQKTFSVAAPTSKAYADNWERTFRTSVAVATTDPVLVVHWTGPLEGDLDGEKLKAPVPGERWPYGPPEAHEDCCLLHRQGLYCDCAASDVSID